MLDINVIKTNIFSDRYIILNLKYRRECVSVFDSYIMKLIAHYCIKKQSAKTLIHQLPLC